MTFDVAKARALCEKASFHLTGNEIDEDLKTLVDQAAMLPAALDEIDRLIHSVDEAVIQLGACRLVAKQIQHEQAKRIAELEAALDEEKYENADALIDICKLRAALKKLGQAKRARGKALVEERATNPAGRCKHASDDYVCDELDGNCGGWDECPCKDELRHDARDQLRQEGLI